MKLRSQTLLVVALLFILPAFQVARAQAPALIVKSIEVQYAGPATVSKERIISNMRTKVGKAYSEQVVEEDIRNLYNTGNISNVRIFGEPSGNDIKVFVVLQTKATVSEVLIDGVTILKVAKLRKQLTVKPGAVLVESTLEQDRQKILDEYQKQGYADTKVQYKVESDDALGTAKVRFTVNESGKTVITRIRFVGNETFRDKELRKAIKTRTRNILSFITKDGRVDNEKFDQDTIALREFYQNHGYVDVEVSQPQVNPLDHGRAEVVYQIKEGKQYHVGKVGVEGAVVFPTDQVRALVKISEGQVFSPKAVKADVKAIQDLYGARGYVDLQATPETVTGGPQVLNVTYRLDEGIQSYIEHVNIQGNKRTKDKVIRRELAVAPGDVYNTVLVDSSKQRLENLKYFSRVDTFPGDTSIPGRKDLNVLVEEQRTGSFNFGAGFSSVDNLVGFVELQQSNFDATHPWDFTGGGQRFRTRLQYGTSRKDFVISLTEPWFMDRQLSLGGEAFFHEDNYSSDVYSQRNYGFDMTLRKPVGKFSSVQLQYKLEEIQIYDIDSCCQGGLPEKHRFGHLLLRHARQSFPAEKRNAHGLHRVRLRVGRRCKGLRV
jgi:outer membrane protein insertion porin family